MNPNERTLELDKILELLAQEAANDMTREQARNLQPQTDLAVVQAELEKTDSALALAVQFGTPPFYAFQDMCTALQRAKAGAKLSLKDLLEIARVLRQVQALSDWYDHCSGVETPLEDLFSRLAPVPFLLEKLERCIFVGCLPKLDWQHLQAPPPTKYSAPAFPAKTAQVQAD